MIGPDNDSATRYRNLAAFALRACDIADRCLKGAVILIALYFFVEFGRAFLPGGPAHQLLCGGR